jgi:hypothetical protein
VCEDCRERLVGWDEYVRAMRAAIGIAPLINSETRPYDSGFDEPLHDDPSLKIGSV